MALFDRWDRDPFDALTQLQHGLDRVFERPFGLDSGLSARRASPPLRVHRDEDGMVVRMEVPGFAAEEVSIEARDDHLVISGTHEPPESEDDSTESEERFGREFSRALRVSREFELGRAQAACKNGVLSVRIPLREDVKPRHIEVRAA